jgi:YidC/Oxa1 family membrane protein insertase
MSADNKNLLLAVVLSVIVLIGWQFFFGVPQMQRQQAQNQAPASQSQSPGQSQPQSSQPPSGAAIPGAPGQLQPSGESQQPGVQITREAALKRSPRRVVIDTPAILGSIALKGGRIDDIALKRYQETVDPKSPNIILFSPPGGPNPYYADFGWIASGEGGGALPGADTEWTADGDRLTADKPVTLTWSNGQGLVFKRTIAVDSNAMFTVKQSIENQGGQAVSLAPFALVVRYGKPQTLGYYILHEGPVGFMNDKLQEPTYDELGKSPVLYGAVRGQVFKDVVGGFLGITDKYWASALVPDQTTPFEGRFTVTGTTTPIYQGDARGPPISVQQGQSGEAAIRLFAGAKEVAAIDGYANSLGIKRFDLMIDWGWFPYITKPLFSLLDFFFKLFGNFGLAILAVTVLVKLAFFPLANKSYASMAKMKAVQPEMMAIRDRYADDKMKQQQALMELYKREKINPVAGCWPIFIQIPVFFALYKVLFITIEMRHAPFYGWIKDLAAPDPTNIFTLFGLLPWTPPELLHLGIWPIIMGITMFLQMKMNPEPTDPVQKTMFAWMPVIFTFMLGTFPAGLVIYWTWNNLLSITQQYFIMRKNGVKVELWDNLRAVIARKAKAQPGE